MSALQVIALTVYIFNASYSTSVMWVNKVLAYQNTEVYEQALEI